MENVLIHKMPFKYHVVYCLLLEQVPPWPPQGHAYTPQEAQLIEEVINEVCKQTDVGEAFKADLRYYFDSYVYSCIDKVFIWPEPKNTAG